MSNSTYTFDASKIKSFECIECHLTRAEYFFDKNSNHVRDEICISCAPDVPPFVEVAPGICHECLEKIDVPYLFTYCSRCC